VDGGPGFRYRLTIINTSGIGFIDSLHWYPPSRVSVLKVTGSTVGECAATGTTGLGGNQFQGGLESEHRARK
jgi:hypothetical protein